MFLWVLRGIKMGYAYIYDSTKRDIARYARKEIKEDLDALKNAQKADLKKLFAELTAHIDRRIDNLELALIAPNSEAAEKLRAKHGLSKPRSISPRS